MNIRQTILDVVHRNESRTFLIDSHTGHEIAYGEFHRRAFGLAAQLERQGLGKGDRVGVMLPNSCELAVLYFACIYLGAVIVPLNPSLSRGDVEYIVQSCRPSFVIAGEASVELLRKLHPRVLCLAGNVSGETLESDTIRIGNPDASANAEAAVFPLASATADDRMMIMYTSGTSARPKGLAHNIGRVFRNATAFAGAQRIDESSRFYLTLSMAYMGGFYNLMILPFLCGASVVVDHVFDARSSLNFWDKAKKNQVNTLWMAPTVLSILLRMDRGRAGEEFCRTSIRHAFVGFAPLPLKVKDEFESRYGVRLIENYGLSETLFVTARSHESSTSRGYVGEAVPGIAVRIASEEGAAVSPGEDGEVQVLTPDLMAGYLGADGSLLEIDSAQWFATGDIGRMDDGGSLCITGRKKDIIIRGGVNISPAAIEESLLLVSGVVEVAVVSIPHELYGEDIVAVVKLESGVELDSMLEALMAHAKSNLAPQQQPARFIAIDDMPRTANGKVQKSRVRELVAEKLQVSTASVRRAAEESAGARR